MIESLGSSIQSIALVQPNPFTINSITRRGSHQIKSNYSELISITIIGRGTVHIFGYLGAGGAGAVAIDFWWEHSC